jgi:hypothetical protein
VALAAALAATACTGQDAGTPGAPVETTARLFTPASAADHVGVWTGPDGAPAERREGPDREFELASRPMPDHCGWESAVVLQVPQPLGTTYTRTSDVQIKHYTRDAEGVLTGFAGAFRGTLDLDAQLPDGATPTGYTLGDIALWLGPDRGADYAYLVRPGAVERWPAEVEPILCA